MKILNRAGCQFLLPMLMLGTGCSSDAGGNDATSSGGTTAVAGASSGGTSNAAGASIGGSGGVAAGVAGGGSAQGGSAGTAQGGTSTGGTAGNAQGGSAGAAQGGSAGTAQGGSGGAQGGSGGQSGGAGGAGGQSAGGDTWSNYAMQFFGTYCVSCHNDDNAGDADRDYTMLAAVQEEIEAIGCGLTKSQEDWEARGCSGFPPATQFPVGNGAMPEDAERDRLLAWIDAGMPE